MVCTEVAGLITVPPCPAAEIAASIHPWISLWEFTWKTGNLAIYRNRQKPGILLGIDTYRMVRSRRGIPTFLPRFPLLHRIRGCSHFGFALPIGHAGENGRPFNALHRHCRTFISVHFA